jgi:hypothetical protein
MSGLDRFFGLACERGIGRNRSCYHYRVTCQRVTGRGSWVDCVARLRLRAARDRGASGRVTPPAQRSPNKTTWIPGGCRQGQASCPWHPPPSDGRTGAPLRFAVSHPHPSLPHPSHPHARHPHARHPSAASKQCRAVPTVRDGCGDLAGDDPHAVLVSGLSIQYLRRLEKQEIPVRVDGEVIDALVFRKGGADRSKAAGGAHAADRRGGPAADLPESEACAALAPGRHPNALGRRPADRSALPPPQGRGRGARDSHAWPARAPHARAEPRDVRLDSRGADPCPSLDPGLRGVG